MNNSIVPTAGIGPAVTSSSGYQMSETLYFTETRMEIQVVEYIDQASLKHYKSVVQQKTTKWKITIDRNTGIPFQEQQIDFGYWTDVPRIQNLMPKS